MTKPRVTNAIDPFRLWQLSGQVAAMSMEAGAIIAMRSMGMMGLWPVGRNEFVGMVAEKPAAFAEAWIEGTWAAMRGAGPEGVLAASLRPIGKKTRSNHRRLTRTALRTY